MVATSVVDWPVLRLWLTVSMDVVDWPVLRRWLTVAMGVVVRNIGTWIDIVVEAVGTWIYICVGTPIKLCLKIIVRVVKGRTWLIILRRAAISVPTAKWGLTEKLTLIE